jgi:hypothetical protein
MKRSVLTLVFVLSTAVVASAQTTFYFPQIADGVFGGPYFKTTILLTNPAVSVPAAISGQVTFTKSDGTALNVSFVDSSGSPVSVGNTIPFQIAGGQTRKYISTGTAAGASGFATVSANGSVSGTAYYSLFSGSTLISEAGVPSATPVLRQAVFVDLLQNFRTAVAYANPSVSTAANITLNLVNTDGVAVMTTTKTLPANSHEAKFVGELFTNPPAMVGTMQINSNTTLVAIALRFSPADEFTTIPPVTIASLLSPYVDWLEQRQWLSPFTSLARLIGSLQFRLG